MRDNGYFFIKHWMNAYRTRKEKIVFKKFQTLSEINEYREQEESKGGRHSFQFVTFAVYRDNGGSVEGI